MLNAQKTKFKRNNLQACKKEIESKTWTAARQ